MLKDVLEKLPKSGA